MRFSLILATVHRREEVENFLLSLLGQTYRDFEVLIIDQNKDDRIGSILPHFHDLAITHLHSPIGLSVARNAGLEHASGEIICFPDDDCTYPPELLENIHRFFTENDYDILMGKTIDKQTGAIVAGRNESGERELSHFFTLGSSTTLFIKNIGDTRFDERFGIGGIFGSEEEHDLVLRLLKSGYKGFYNPNIDYVYHPPSDLDYTDLERIKERSVGLGAFIAKHWMSKEGFLYFFKYNIIRPLSGSLIHLARFDLVRSKFYFFKWLGIWKGFFKYFGTKNETRI